MPICACQHGIYAPFEAPVTAARDVGRGRISGEAAGRQFDPQSLIRLQAGIEPVADVIADIGQSLKAAR